MQRRSAKGGVQVGMIKSFARPMHFSPLILFLPSRGRACHLPVRSFLAERGRARERERAREGREGRGGEGGVLNAIKIINNCPRSPRNETNVAIHPDVKLGTF